MTKAVTVAHPTPLFPPRSSLTRRFDSSGMGFTVTRGGGLSLTFSARVATAPSELS